MNAYVTDFVVAKKIVPSVQRQPRLEKFLRDARIDRTALVSDADQVEAQYHALLTGLGQARVHYALGSNTDPEVLSRVARLGAGVDVASRDEIELCRKQGVSITQVYFRTVVRNSSDVSHAFGIGVTQFSAQTEEELEIIAEHAPSMQVYIRLVVDAVPIDRQPIKQFSRARAQAMELLDYARELGLKPEGFSFQLGNAGMWTTTFDQS